MWLSYYLLSLFDSVKKNKCNIPSYALKLVQTTCLSFKLRNNLCITTKNVPLHFHTANFCLSVDYNQQHVSFLNKPVLVNLLRILK